MEIKIYEDKYRDDMISMVLQAKAALGRPSSLNEDLLDIKANYFQRGDMFCVAVDDDDRVVGCCGYSKTENAKKAFVHRLYVKASEKFAAINSYISRQASLLSFSRGNIYMKSCHIPSKT